MAPGAQALWPSRLAPLAALVASLLMVVAGVGVAVVSLKAPQASAARTTYDYDGAVYNGRTRRVDRPTATADSRARFPRASEHPRVMPSSLAPVVAAEVESGGLTIGEKIAGQMGPRGWTEESIAETVAGPAETHPVWDYTTGAQEPATAYVRPDGSYVVVNDATGNVVQVSDATNPNWKPVWDDPRFQR